MTHSYIISPDCIITQGVMRGTVSDLTRENFYIIPNFDSLDEIKKNKPLWNFLLKEEILISVNNECKSSFVPIDLTFDTYSKISNIAMEYSEKGFSVMSDLVEDLICKDIAVVVEQGTDFFIKEIYEKTIQLLSLDINKIEFHILDETISQKNINFLNEISKSYNFIKFVVYIKTFPNQNTTDNSVVLLKHNAFNQKNISVNKFHVNIQFFSEANSYNVYFNRKLAIDNHGNIKSSLNGSKVYGNIHQSKDEIIKIIESKDFQKIWHSKKDIISVCKDCEFRFICPYKEEPKQRDDGTWFHTIECNYNPYICKWKNEEEYHTLKESGIISNYDKFEIDFTKQTEIINKIWG